VRWRRGLSSKGRQSHLTARAEFGWGCSCGRLAQMDAISGNGIVVAVSDRCRRALLRRWSELAAEAPFTRRRRFAQDVERGSFRAGGCQLVLRLNQRQTPARSG
jgi:hypothetical protein